MIFKELINTVNYNHMWAVLDKEYNHKDGAYEAYKRVIEELKTLKPRSCKPPITLIVAKIEDCIEPGTSIFDVFGIIKGDKNHYALEMTSWDEWLNFNVLDKCIEVYGNADVTAYSLYEMTFFGYSKKTVDERVKQEKRILDKSIKEIESGTSQLISFEEAMAKIGFIDKRTPMEKEKECREYWRITAMNEKIYKMLLGR
ncbi:MAG: hypothetical protein H8E13_21255 [Actinobacteria bacterium]|nr:hypothetical protein [Actinomycetota bacterium]